MNELGVQWIDDWVRNWESEAIRPELLRQIAIHLLAVPRKPNEDRAVVAALISLIKSGNSPADTEATPPPCLPSPEALIKAGQNQWQEVYVQWKHHPFLQLLRNSDATLRGGCRVTVERIVGYKTDKRRKPQSLAKEWEKLFRGSKRLIKRWWKQHPRKHAITELVHALTGDKDRRKGLAQELRDVARNGSPQRQAATDEQARLLPDGGFLPMGGGVSRAVLVAAGVIDYETAVDGLSLSKADARGAKTLVELRNRDERRARRLRAMDALSKIRIRDSKRRKGVR